MNDCRKKDEEIWICNGTRKEEKEEAKEVADEALFFNTLQQACWFLRCRIEYLGGTSRREGRRKKKLVGGQQERERALLV